MYRKHLVPITCVAGCLLLTACNEKKSASSNDDSPAGKAAPTAAAPPEPAPAPPGRPSADSPFGAHFDRDATLARLQGAWIVGGSSLGTNVAWLVEGTKVTESDGERDTVYELELLAPCRARTKDPAEGVSVYHTFAFAGDTLYSGLGSAGVRTDTGVVVCNSGKVFVLADGTCTAWEEFFGKWESSPTTCTFENGEFRVGTAVLEVSEASDRTLVDTQMKGNVARRFPDLAAAKAALAE